MLRNSSSGDSNRNGSTKQRRLWQLATAVPTSSSASSQRRACSSRLTGHMALPSSLSLALLLLLPALTHAERVAQPHIIMILGDDIGFANVGWNRAVPTKEVQASPHAICRCL